MLLDRVDSPKAIKKFSFKELEVLAGEIRQRIIDTTSITGGHVAPSLGAVELTIALHYVLDSPKDKIVWDVGHQIYAHKLLTGRQAHFSTLRQHKGLSGFPKREESEHDIFDVGHASTSISAALGIAEARDIKKEKFEVFAVIGDGSLSGGMAFEGLNNAGYLGTDMTVVLNDNKMSISPNVGAMSNHLRALERMHHVSTDSKPRREIKTIFERLGFTHMGPVDGHSVKDLVGALEEAKKARGPKLLHVITVKGKGFAPAEQTPSKFHGLGPYDSKTGRTAPKKDSYSSVFAAQLVEEARKDKGVVAITAAMPAGTGLSAFAKEFPKRFYDVGIAEEHAVTFAAGLSVQGMNPAVAIYSTFLQRAFDQVIHDVALQELPVKFFLDRGGLVGDDGPTHHGCFDLSYLRIIPGMTVMASSSENELRDMVRTAMSHSRGPMAVRFPRGSVSGEKPRKPSLIEIGKSLAVRRGRDVSIIAIGSMVKEAERALEPLEAEGISAELINARFAKPLDEKAVVSSAKKTGTVITVEENALPGGFGSAVEELLHDAGLHDVRVHRIGIPDYFIEQGSQEILMQNLELTAENIFYTAKYWLKCSESAQKCKKDCIGKQGHYCFAGRK